MMLTIETILERAELSEIRAALAAMRFEDGRATAGFSARLVKDNEQAREGATLRLLRERVTTALRRHPVFEAAVRPKALTAPIFGRYGIGRHYGTHIDNPLIDGVRTDVSYTLFLSDPESYEGGELVIEGPSGEDEVKLAAGNLVLYPSTTLHRVAAVTRGERLVAVGWVQSYVREADKRELLFDLERARQGLFERSGKTPEFDLLAKCGANLLRMWADA
jgi:PKHD-type hydroxylase